MDQNDTQSKFALRLIEQTNAKERTTLISWLENLLALRAENSLSAREKTKRAILLTKNKKIIFPMIKMIAKQMKTHLWDHRNSGSRFALIGTGIGLSFFSGQSAGIAALGTAIGVPLWVVFGAGASFAGLLINAAKNKNNEIPDAEYEVIDIQGKK